MISKLCDVVFKKSNNDRVELCTCINTSGTDGSTEEADTKEVPVWGDMFSI